MKKNILFVLNNLNCGGAEKALISLLETIDYSLYNVDLFLFKHEGIFLNKIPKQVQLLEEPMEYKYFDMSLKTAAISCLMRGKINIALQRLLAGYIFRTEQNKARCEQRVWKYLSKSLRGIKKNYDVAIGFLEKNPIYFCVDKVKASKKVGFIHTDYDKMGMDSVIDKKYFQKLNQILTVSEECSNRLKMKFPLFSEKIDVMYNIVSPKIIQSLSLEKTDVFSKGTMIVSVGRLHHLKGFDIAIRACHMLIQSEYDIRWYIVGDGEEREKLENMIAEYHLQERFVLLGETDNPYPYIRAADIYVHPSRFEGKSIAIDEAKILCKPIVITNFPTAKDQIKHHYNGIITEMNPNSIAQELIKLIENEELRNTLITNLSSEVLGTESEINKFYNFIAM